MKLNRKKKGAVEACQTLTPKELELKFENLANTQLKFIPVESAALIIKKMRTFCNIIGIQFQDDDTIVIIDKYFDDDHSMLQTRQCSLRCRKEAERHLITLKSGKVLLGNGSLRRDETEVFYDKKKFPRIAEQMRAILTESPLKSAGIDYSSLKARLTIHNHRTSAQLHTKRAKYKFCFDKFYFYDHHTGRYSEYFSEIEIESTAQQRIEDDQLAKLREFVTNILNYIPNQMSKCERGLDWINKRQEIKTIYAAAFDIIRYSLKSADIQKQMIQSLSHTVKAAIREIRGSGEEENVIHLPTGDGMILVFEDRPETIVPIVFNIQKRIKEFNNTRGPSEQFEFRTGLHSGPVFKYSDVNESLNFAGNGINLAQRVMSLGDEWHILATDAAYEAMGNIDQDLKKYFKSIGERDIKHDLVIKVFNVFSSDHQAGNPSDLDIRA